MRERSDEPPAHDRHPPSAQAASPPDPRAAQDARAARHAPPISESEQRPSGALAVVAFLVVAILVSWFGMFALNAVRN